MNFRDLLRRKANNLAGPKNIVLVNSKIVVSSTSFTYTATRSKYSTEERFRQTKQTIKTARKYVPNNYIVLIDNSVLPVKMADDLTRKVDVLINPTTDPTLNEDTDANPTKAVGELAQILAATRYIDNLSFAWNHLFKLCGRYTLNSEFDYSAFDNPRNVFKINVPLSNFKSAICYFTSFYKISSENYLQYKEALTDSYHLFKNDARYSGEPLELVLCNNISDKFLLDRLGITIDCAVDSWIEQI